MATLKSEQLVHIYQSLELVNRQLQSTEGSLALAHQSVLMALVEKGAMNLTDLANYRQVKKSTMSVMMDHLLDENLVVSGNSKSDRRQRFFLITNKGREQLEQHQAVILEWMQDRLGEYSESEVTLLLNMLSKLTK